MLEGLHNQESIAESVPDRWWVGSWKSRTAGTSRAVITDEVEVLRRETHDLKKLVAEHEPELWLFKKV